MRRQALDGERPGDTDAGTVFVGAVVEVFDVGLAGDGGVDAPLPLDAGLPPGGVGLLGLRGPGGFGGAGDLPILPLLAEGSVEGGAQGFERGLRLLLQHVDLGVVGDGFESDVRRALIDEAVADVVMGGRIRLHAAGDGLFLRAAFNAVCE